MREAGVPTKHVRRRFNPLAGEWVGVAPDRTQRLWRGVRCGDTGTHSPVSGVKRR